MSSLRSTGVLILQRRTFVQAVVLAYLSGLWPIAVQAGEDMPTVVKIQREGTGYNLLRDGRPYVIKGGGGRLYLEALKAAGGNSLRTWGEDDLEPLLDRAQELGLTVTVGIWLGQERQGFNYADAGSVRREVEKARAFFRRYRRHPALLMWGLGNEMEGSGDNPVIWRTVNEIARVAKSEDPNHPTMTVIAEAGGRKISQFLSLCPDVDVLGINSYGGLPTLPKRLADAGMDRPYVITEFGPPGPWEVRKTRLGRTRRTDEHRKGQELPRQLLWFDRRPARAVPRLLRFSLGPQAGGNGHMVRNVPPVGGTAGSGGRNDLRLDRSLANESRPGTERLHHRGKRRRAGPGDEIHRNASRDRPGGGPLGYSLGSPLGEHRQAARRRSGNGAPRAPGMLR